MSASQGRLCKRTFSYIFKQSFTGNRSSTIPMWVVRRFSSSEGRRPVRGQELTEPESDDLFSRSSGLGGFTDEDEARRRSYEGHQNPPEPIPNRPLRGAKRIQNSQPQHPSLNNQPSFRGGNRDSRQSKSTIDRFPNKFDDDFNGGNRMRDDDERKMNKSSSTLQFLKKPSVGEKGSDPAVDSFLDKFKLGVQKKENPPEIATPQLPKEDAKPASEPPPQADEIFQKMKETGLIPNAVAMLDGLCKDGLVQEAMKLFGLMREKGTIPEVVIYTAVVEGFCKAQKPDDAKRIFRKMQTNGIPPNAFSYTVLIKGLQKCNNLESAVEFCEEMLEAGHSPNVTTFVGLVDGFCREKGVEEAGNLIERLRQKGFFVDDKSVREYLDKKGPFSPLVWETILGKKSSQKPF